MVKKRLSYFLKKDISLKKNKETYTARKKLEISLLSIAKFFDKFSSITNTKPLETVDYKLPNLSESFLFDKPLSLEDGEVMLG